MVHKPLTDGLLLHSVQWKWYKQVGSAVQSFHYWIWDTS